MGSDATFFAVTCMQCYNITFFLRLPLLRGTEQGASQGSCSPTAPRCSHEKPGFFFPLREAEGYCEENQVTFKPWPVRPPTPVSWQKSLKGSMGAE